MNSHLGIKNHVCNYPDCPKSFVTTAQLSRHIQLTHEKEKKMFICQYCPNLEMKFPKKTSYRDHLFQAHGIAAFQCQFGIIQSTNQHSILTINF